MGQAKTKDERKKTLEVGLRAALIAAAQPDSHAERIKSIADSIISEGVIRSVLKLQKKDIYHVANSHFKERAARYKKNEELQHECLTIQLLDVRKDEFDFDGGGYRREFFTDYFRECACDKSMFRGRNRRLVPHFDASNIQNGSFVALGIAIVESVLNGDCGFPYLHPAVVHFMLNRYEYEPFLSVEDIPDLDIADIAEQISAAKSQTELEDIVLKRQTDCIDNIGWPSGEKFTLDNRRQLLHLLTKWCTIERRRGAIDELQKGLEYLGFLKIIKERDDGLLWPLLVNTGHNTCDAAYLHKVLKPSIEKLATKSDVQKKAKEFCLTAVEEISDADSVLLFYFITGLRDPPVRQEILDVDFLDSRKKPDYKLPESKTCFGRLLIPTGNKSYNEFKQSFQTAIQNKVE